jgi:hypothetical protein
MPNLITHSLTFTKESVAEYFLKPLFVDNDIRDIVQVRTDLKTGEKLDMISKLSKITKGYQQGASFTPSTGVTITQKTITVVTMKAEVHQNGRAFLNYVKQEFLRSGYEMNDINGTIFEQMVLQVFMRALMADLNRQLFFGDVTKETITSNAPTGTLDDDYKEYDGFWTRVIDDIVAGTIPAGQRYDVNVTALQDQVAVANVRTATLTGSSGTCNVVVNGVNYLATFATDLTTTAANWVTAHGATIAARFGGATVTSSAAAIAITSGVPGLALTVTVSAALSGNLTGSVANTTANVQNTTLKAGAGKAILKAMYDRMTPELRENMLSARYLVSGSIMDAYITDLEADGTEAAHVKLIDGVRSISFRGIPVVERRDWDVHIAADFANVRPHRAMLVLPENLVVGTDATSDVLNAEMWYDQNSQENKFRVEYNAGTQYIHPEYIVAAY